VVDAQGPAEADQSVFALAAIEDLFAPGALFAVAATIFGILLKLINDDKDRIRLFFAVAETPWWPAYARLLAGLSSAFDQFFGRKLLGWRAFERCLFLALIYPYVALIFWMFFFREARDLKIKYPVWSPCC